MRLVGPDEVGEGDDDLNFYSDDVESYELEAVAYRFTQIVPDRCEKTAKNMAQSGVNHPVVFLCDVADPFGLSIAKKVSTSETIEQALKETGSDMRPGVFSGVDLDSLEGKELTIFLAIKNTMAGLIGYFPIVVAAREGFTVFPWPYKINERSKFKLFSSA